MSDAARKFETCSPGQAVPDIREAAAEAGLLYVSDERPGIRRKAGPGGFVYFNARGDRIRDESTIDRIRSLAVPPAYTDVWICAKANGHIQATGRDARGRKQYRYHALWNEARGQTKYDRMPQFGAMLPALRARLRDDMGRRGLPRDKVLATIVNLLEATLIRIGNEDYAQKNKSYGLTTLRNGHVAVEASELRFRFMGKSGKCWTLAVKDRRVAKIVRACQELPGQHHFEFVDEQGSPKPVNSADVNAYLREITGEEITAKDFRTWHGTVLAAMALSEYAPFETQAHGKRNVRAAIGRVAESLGNTATVCRKCYVHPEVLASYKDGSLLDDFQVVGELAEPLSQLKSAEIAVLALLEKRLKAAGR